VEKSPREKAEEALKKIRRNEGEYREREPKDRDWSAINKAGHNEASTFKHLLATLVSELEKGTNQGRDRNGIDTRDMIFNICLTEYLNTSNRRVLIQLEEAEKPRLHHCLCIQHHNQVHEEKGNQKPDPRTDID